MNKPPLCNPEREQTSAQQLGSRIPKTGGTPVVLASTQSTASGDAYFDDNAVALAVDDTYVYWLWEGHGQILKLAK